METIEKSQAVHEVRIMAYQFARLYFDFTKTLYETFGREEAITLTQKALFRRAYDRACVMREKAEQMGVERTPEAIHDLSDVPYLGWDSSLGVDHCPYGKIWRELSDQYPWFREFAALYCDVTDTTIAEVFTGTHSHKLYENVVLGDRGCNRRYFEDENVKNGQYTYGQP